MPMPRFTLNGESHEIADGSSLADVIDAFAPIGDSDNLFYLISVNGKIVRARASEAILQTDDDVELIPQSYGG